jgi:hypothetical protein
MAARLRRPTLEQVLANVRRGQVAYLVLTDEQKRGLREPTGRVALDVLRHLLGARPANPGRFPLTEQAFQAVACKLGYRVGQKRSRGMIRRLLEAGVIAGAGQYRQPYRNSAARSGFCVALLPAGAPCSTGCRSPPFQARASCRQRASCQAEIPGSLVAAPAVRGPSRAAAARFRPPLCPADEATSPGFPVAAVKAAHGRCTSESSPSSHSAGGSAEVRSNACNAFLCSRQK